MSDDDKPQNWFKGAGSGFEKLLGGGPNVTPPIIPKLQVPVFDPTYMQEILENTEFDDSTQRTAEHTEAMATYMADLVTAMNRSVQLNEETRLGNERVERFTRRISISSLIIAIASLIAAVAAIVVSAVSGG